MKKFLCRGALAALAVFLLLLAGCASEVPPSFLACPVTSASADEVPAAPDSPEGDADRYYVVEKNGLKGVVNGLGQTVLPFDFSEAWVFGEEGVINGLDKLAFGPSQTYVCGDGAPAFIFAGIPTEIADAFYHEGYIYSLDGKLLYDKKCYEADPLGGGLIKYIDLDGNSGVITCQGAEIVPGGYCYLDICREYIVTAAYGEGPTEINIYGRDGTLLKSGRFNLFRAVGGLLEVAGSPDEGYGLIDTQFKEIVPAECGWVGYAGGGLYIIERNGKYGVIDERGKEIIPFGYDDVKVCGGSSGAPFFSASGQNGAYVFDSSGEQLMYLEGYASAQYYGEVVIAKDKGGMDHLLKDGKSLVTSELLTWDDEAQAVMSMYAGTCACFTKDGEKLPLPRASVIGYVSPDRFFFCTMGTRRYGICGRDGSVIVPAEYDSLSKFGESSFYIFPKTGVGKTTACVIDTENGDIILKGFDALADAGGGLLYAKSGACRELIDINGNWVWRSSFEG